MPFLPPNQQRESTESMVKRVRVCGCCQDEDAVNSWCYLHENDVVALLNQFPLQRVFNHVFNCTHTAGQCSLLHWAVKPPCINKTLTGVEAWASRNNFRLNRSKSKELIFSATNQEKCG